jgi:uracil-DNA glycosylase
LRFDKDYLIELELDSHFAMRAVAAEAFVPAARLTLATTATAATTATTAKSAPIVIARPTPTIVAKTTSPEPVVIDPARATKIAALSHADLAKDANACQACGLCKGRKQAVVGVGEANAPWLFVGEAPGTEEDDTGEPFVGQAGKLLDAMIKSLGLTRGKDVYLTNVVKCRAPGNRPPQLDEVGTCAPYLDRQIDILKPKMILALGKTAITRLTGSDDTLNNLRGKVHIYRSVPVVATFHPAYLLLRLPEKLKAWEDLMFARQEFNKQKSSSSTL